MKNLKKQKTEYLLREIGELDDKLISEALEYRTKRKSLSSTWLIAAAFTLVFALTVGSNLISRLNLFVGNKGESTLDREEIKIQSVEELFLENNSHCLFDGRVVLSSEELPYFSDCAHIVWQNIGESGYYVSEGLQASEVEMLKEEMGNGVQTGETSPTLNYKVWVLYGDGKVTSPYLKQTDGNISGEIFDYEAEIIPEEKFVQILLEALQ